MVGRLSVQHCIPQRERGEGSWLVVPCIPSLGFVRLMSPPRSGVAAFVSLTLLTLHSTLDTPMLDTLRLETGDPPHSYLSAALAALAALVSRPLGCYESLHPQRSRPRLALRRLRSQIVTASSPSLPSNNFCFTCHLLRHSHTLGSLSLLCLS